MRDNKMILQEIDLKLIDPNPKNAALFDMTRVEHMANIISEEGFTTPIEVFKKDDGRYEITSGHRRYEAMKLLKKKTIPCLITDKYESDTQKDRKLLSSNIATRKISPLEMAYAISFYKDILKKEKYKGKVREKIAEYFGISPSNVYRYECLLKLIPELQEFCKKPQFPYSSLRAAATLTPEEQKELYDELVRLEASKAEQIDLDNKNSKDEDKLDDIDKDEIIFSRTRIEQIINGKIKKIKTAEETKASVADDFMPAPIIDDEEDKYEENSIEDFIIKDTQEKTIILDDDDIFGSEVSEEDPFLKGFDTCIKTINAYKNNSSTTRNKAAVKKKIKELKDAVETLEALL